MPRIPIKSTRGLIFVGFVLGIFGSAVLYCVFTKNFDGLKVVMSTLGPLAGTIIQSLVEELRSKGEE